MSRFTNVLYSDETLVTQICSYKYFCPLEICTAMPLTTSWYMNLTSMFFALNGLKNEKETKKKNINLCITAEIPAHQRQMPLRIRIKSPVCR